MKSVQKIKISIFIIWMLNVVLLIIGVIGLLMTPFLFDAPGSENSVLVWVNAVLISSIPFFVIVLFILSIRMYKQKDYKKALKLSSFPIYYVLIVYFQFWLKDLF